MTVPPEAVHAAAAACPFVNRDALARALGAAAPHIAAAERVRLADLHDEDFTRTGPNPGAPGYNQGITDVTGLVARAVLRERERTIQMLEAAAPRFAAYPAALRKAVALLREGDTQ